MRLMISAAAHAARYQLWLAAQVGEPDFPVAVPDTASTGANTPVTFAVLTNDTHPNGDILAIVSATVSLLEGAVTINVDATLTFTPALGFSGPATITYVVEDEGGEQATGTATVSVAVEPAPTANPGTATTAEDTPVTFDLLANDTHPIDDSLTVTSVTLTSGSGSVVDNMDGTATFTPAANWNGTAVVSYTIEDTNGDIASSTHTITVTPVADNPVAGADTGTTSENVAVNIDVLANDTDPDGGTLTLVSATVADPAQGTAAIVSGQVRYSPASGFIGTATISYVVQNTGGAAATGSISVTVTDVPDVDADLFTDAVAPYYSRQVNGATTAITATGSAHWGAKEGLGGAGTTTGTEWRVTIAASRGTVRLTGSSLTLTDGKTRVRWRCQPVDVPMSKLYVGFDVSAMTNNFFVAFDVTNDATADNARVSGATSNITNAGITKHPTDGWWYVRFDVDVTGWADRGGSLNLYMLDNPGTDLLVTRTPFYLVRCENLTLQAV